MADHTTEDTTYYFTKGIVMKISNYSDYYIDMQKFGNLFSEAITTETVELLKKPASDGDLNSIELLHNLALRQDKYGKQAENILFDLYIGQPFSDKNRGVVKKIQDAALALYRISVDKGMKNNTDMHKLRTPSKLLYMAGAAADIGEKMTLSRLYNQPQRAYSQHEQLDEQDIWDPARMITSDEINAVIKFYARNNNMPASNFPIGLINPHSHENMLSQQINSQKESGCSFKPAEFFPINTGDHWVTFGLYRSPEDGQLHAVTCNTANPLSSQTKKHIIDSAQLAGVKNLNHIVFLEKNIQDNIPNGCGLLTVNAIKALIDNNFQSPVEILETFLSSFSQYSVEEQEWYNLQNRYHIYSETYLQ